MDTRTVLNRCNALDAISFELECISRRIAAHGCALAAGQVMAAADNLSAESAFIWQSRHLPEVTSNVIDLTRLMEGLK